LRGCRLQARRHGCARYTEAPIRLNEHIAKDGPTFLSTLASLAPSSQRGRPRNRSIRTMCGRDQARQCRPSRCRAGAGENWNRPGAYDFQPNVRTATLSVDIPLEGHFSANGMPHRACVIPTACGSTRQDIRSRPRSPSWCPLSGEWGLVCESPVPALSTGTGYFRRSSRGPRRVEGCGKCAGGNAGLISGESTSANAAKQ
jgi:hypothetical protein